MEVTTLLGHEEGVVSHATPMKPFMFRIPSRIIFGENTAERLPEFAKEYRPQRTLAITDTVLRRIGLADKVLDSLKSIGQELVIFEDVEPEPSIQNAEKVAAAARRVKYDLVIGLGGGSVLDMAKVASVAATNPGPVTGFIGVDKIQRRGLPMILLPTTSGTGSEVTMNSVVKAETDSIKTGIVSQHLLADIAVVDPSLALTMPPKTTAATGLDALSHAVESLMSVDSNPVTESLALEAVKLIFSSLEAVYQNGDNISARSNMALASVMAGAAFGNAGVCAGHAAAYAFAVKYGIPHGVSCAIALPYVMEYNAPACMSALAAIDKTLGRQERTVEKDAFDAVWAVRNLIEDVGIPLSLKELGVKSESIPKLAEDLLKSGRLLAHNPRPITLNDARDVFGRIHRGEALPYSAYSKAV